MFVNIAGWPGIVMEATRGNDPTIIPMTEIFGFEHECGSIYTNEIMKRVPTVKEFNMWRSKVGMENEPIYFKGELIERE